MTGAKFTFLNDKNGALWKVWKIKRKKNQITPFSSCLLSPTFMHYLESGFDCIAAAEFVPSEEENLHDPPLSLRQLVVQGSVSTALPPFPRYPSTPGLQLLSPWKDILMMVGSFASVAMTLLRTAA